MPYYLGIDLHKRESTWALIDEERTVLARATLPATPAGISRGLATLPVPPGALSIALEPVCGWRWVHDQLTKAGATVTIANPLKTRLISESRLKHDRVDALTLAELLRADFLPEAWVAPPAIASLRSVVRARQYLVEIRTGLKNRTKGVVCARGMHEVRDTCLKRAGQELLVHGSDPELADLITLIRTLDAHIATYDRTLATWVRKDPTAQLLMSVPPIGPVTAATICAEVGDFARFPGPRQLASYAGLATSERSSGGKRKHGRITKVGSRYLRTACVESAMRLRPHHDTTLFAFYERVRARSSPMKARVALGRKLLTICWFLVKKQEPFRALVSAPGSGTSSCVLSEA